MRKTITTIATAAAAIAASAGFAIAAQASTPAAAQPAGAVHACVLPTGHLDFLQFRTANYGKCAKGDAAWIWAQQGAKGDTGPSGVVSTGTHDLGGKASIATGGSFVTSATDVGEISLPAGTYLVSVAAKATPAMTSAVQVFPVIAIYNQAANAAFDGDLLNVGSGALESGGNTNIDSYYDGSGQITLATATTLHVYAFGYDSDRGSGSYALDDLTVTATQVTPAS